MTSSLRERRRRQTAREIQRATLHLAEDEGLEMVTVERIATAAGISPRTFFNYYPNKEPAVIGQPPGFPKTVVTAFLEGQGPLSEDLRALLRGHLLQLEEDREALTALLRLSRLDPKVRLRHDTLMAQLRDELADILRRRLPEQDPLLLLLLTDVLLAAGRVAIDHWLTCEGASIDSILDEVWLRMPVLAELIC